MQLGLRTKLTLIMTGLVLLTVTVLSLVFLEQLLQQVLYETDQRANDLAREIFDSASHALEDAKLRGFLPSSDEEQDTHDYVRKAFETSDGLEARLKSTDAAWVYEVSIVDRDGEVLVSSDSALIGKTVVRRPPLAQLVQMPFVRQVRILAEKAQQYYEVDLPFKIRGVPFGEVRVVVSTALLLNNSPRCAEMDDACGTGSAAFHRSGSGGEWSGAGTDPGHPGPTGEDIGR